jgi:hypothetical protein
MTGGCVDLRKRGPFKKGMAIPNVIRRRLETFGLYANRLIVDALSARLRAVSHNLESRQLLPDLELEFIPQTSYALGASATRIILNDVVLNRRRCVVELGSGMSTLYLSRILHEKPGAMLISIDHDSDWLAWVARQLWQMGTDSVVSLIHAPLETVSPGGVEWYDRAEVEHALAGITIDALVVDGPRALNGRDAETRSHALPLLRAQLNPDSSIVFMDDIKRAGERKIYNKWARDFAMDQLDVAEFCGLGILVPHGQGPKFAIV